ncbi:putative sinapine esterase [Helianthus debilis subsp. tardiflorus]
MVLKCLLTDCKNYLRNSLILMGEIGGNDYNHPVMVGKPIDELRSYVPLVIDTIVFAINVFSSTCISYIKYNNVT